MNYTIYDFIGNVGAGLIILMYLLQAMRKIRASQLSYSLWNAIGAALIAFSLCFNFNLSAFIIEFFWLLISLYGIIQGLRTK